MSYHDPSQIGESNFELYQLQDPILNGYGEPHQDPESQDSEFLFYYTLSNLTTQIQTTLTSQVAELVKQTSYADTSQFESLNGTIEKLIVLTESIKTGIDSSVTFLLTVDDIKGDGYRVDELIAESLVKLNSCVSGILEYKARLANLSSTSSDNTVKHSIEKEYSQLDAVISTLNKKIDSLQLQKKKLNATSSMGNTQESIYLGSSKQSFRSSFDGGRSLNSRGFLDLEQQNSRISGLSGFSSIKTGPHSVGMSSRVSDRRSSLPGTLRGMSVRTWKPWYKKKWVFGCIIIGFIAIIVVTVVMVLHFTKKKNS
ncbi:hypothetical protein CANARDRAFT_29234 [[Candida] arabinofermentans NRRL YB-2248]|uniref:Uncharacterized protein n=1 Tax=[Candida] arabinofermentans NRRL YB-2248 TaxID=983967 RepID=A0A1E4SXZ6_9ASCO|nr:hypothetical protein CANARDRAFT_29234 [[Candida] arabinofermentans NRRL YB-2248]